jgi:hypothetical protein
MRLTDVGAAITAAELTLASNGIVFTLGCGITVTPDPARAQVEGGTPQAMVQVAARATVRSA